jgi:MFS family permease
MVHSLRALRYRNYRIFLGGQGVALIGTWCQRVAVAWLVYRTTGSALLLGVAAFAGDICFLLIAPFGGLIADRVQRGRALMLVQVVSALQAFTLALLVWAGLAGFGVVVALSLLLGACQAVEMPLRQAMFSDLVDDPQDLPNAIALMAFMNNAGRLIGPTVAGFVIGVAGEDACFAINGFGYLFVIVALLRMRLPPTRSAGAGGAVLAELRAGFGYAWGCLPIRATLGLLCTVGFCFLPYLVIMPVFTRDVLHADARTLGLLLSAAGLGAVGGLLWIASSAEVRSVPRLLTFSGASGGLGMAVLSASAAFLPAVIAMAAVGFGIVVTATASNVYLQAVSAPDKRGRVLGLFTMCFLGVAPFGNLVAGTLIERLGCQPTLLLLGLLGLACTAWFRSQRSRVEWVVAQAL